MSREAYGGKKADILAFPADKCGKCYRSNSDLSLYPAHSLAAASYGLQFNTPLGIFTDTFIHYYKHVLVCMMLSFMF